MCDRFDVIISKNGRAFGVTVKTSAEAERIHDLWCDKGFEIDILEVETLNEYEALAQLAAFFADA